MKTVRMPSQQSVPVGYMFYGSIPANAAALLRDADRVHAGFWQTSPQAILDSVVPLQNQAALELFRAGRWAHARALVLNVVDLLENLPNQSVDEAVIGSRAAALLNLARLEASRENFPQAATWFKSMLALPIKRYDIILPEVVRAAKQTGAVGDALEFIDALLPAPASAQPHLARARANLFALGARVGDARRLLETVDYGVFSPVERCWFGLERATIVAAAGDSAGARVLLADTHKAITDLQAEIPSCSPMPLLLAIELADRETNVLGPEAGALRLRATRDRSLLLGMECLALRAATSLVTTLRGRSLLRKQDLEILRNLVERSRYRVEVFGGWWSLGRVLALSREADVAALGSAYLGKLVAEDVAQEASAVRRLVDEAHEMIDRHGIVASPPNRRFFDDEPPVLDEMRRAMASLGHEVRAVCRADV